LCFYLLSPTRYGIGWPTDTQETEERICTLSDWR
jgi:hypothetical protein